MKEASVRDAKSGLTGLLREVERGNAVRLTRRGRPVAVLMSERQYARLQRAEQSQQSFASFLPAWRRRMIAKGLAFLTDDELADMRDYSPTPSAVRRR